MKTVAMRKAAKAKANGDGNGKSAKAKSQMKKARQDIKKRPTLGTLKEKKPSKKPYVPPTEKMSKHSSKMIERVDKSLKAEKEGKKAKAKRLMRKAGRSNKRFLAARKKRDNKN